MKNNKNKSSSKKSHLNQINFKQPKMMLNLGSNKPPSFGRNSIFDILTPLQNNPSQMAGQQITEKFNNSLLQSKDRSPLQKSSDITPTRYHLRPRLQQDISPTMFLGTHTKTTQADKSPIVASSSPRKVRMASMRRFRSDTMIVPRRQTQVQIQNDEKSESSLSSIMTDSDNENLQ